MRLAEWLYEKLEHMNKKPNQILYNSAVREDLQTLEPAGNTPKRQKEYVIRKLSICIMIVLVGVTVAAALWIKEGTATKIADNQISRNLYGDGAKSVSLIADNGEKTYEIPLNIEERSYTQEELMAMAEPMLPLLEEKILGENQSFDEIVYDLALIDEIEGYPFQIEWHVDEEYMDYKGKLMKDTLDTPQLIEVTAVLWCESFEIEHTIPMRIYSKAEQPKESVRIESALKQEEQNSRMADKVVLPEELENKRLHWSYKRSYASLIVFVAIPILVVFVYFSSDRDLHGQVEKREEQMRLDYPEIVSSLALLIGAGMTVPNAWNKIAKDYKNRREECGQKRYAYEEMLLTVYEMDSGVIQTMAYERFGRRCRNSDYNKLSTMLSQNIRKGAANLPILLKEEAANAFEERKHGARKQGEKAGTKLLIPMMMLLGITMIIIMVPAFQIYL